MTQPVKADDDEQDDIDLIHALKTAFSDDGDPEMFLARAADQIREVETTIIDTCAKNRIRIDDNLYALLEARDAISEQTGQLDKSTQTASEITVAVDEAMNTLTAKLQVRKNLDAALAVAAQTRKLTRMYARIEDTIDSRRLYTALRMLQLLEAETAAVQPHTFLHELVPDARRLRAHISQHALRGTHAWHKAVRRFERALGRYALYHAAAQAASDRVLFDCPRGAMRESVALLSAGPPPPMPRRRSAARPFTPLLAQNAEPEKVRRTGTPGLQPGAGLFPGGATVRAGVGERTRNNPGGGVDDEVDEMPKVYLRPLLQGVLVGDGLHLLGDMRSEYRRERLAHLRRVLDGVEEDGDLEVDERDEGDGAAGDGATGEDDDEEEVVSSGASGLSRAREIERLVWRVAGFFVVERSVETHSSQTLVSRDVVDGEWWPLAYARLDGLFKQHEESVLETQSEKAIVRSVEEDLERFAVVNGLMK